MKIATLPTITDEERAASASADAATHQGWITCRVCKTKSKVSLSNAALLCNPCRVDPAQTRAHILHLRDTYRERLWRAGQAWERTLEEASEDGKAGWARVEKARDRLADGEIDSLAFSSTWQRARARGDALSRLLLAWEEWEDEAQACGEELERCERALEEIEAYERQ